MSSPGNVPDPPVSHAGSAGAGAPTPRPASAPAGADLLHEPVVVRGCDDLVAAVPHLVGFTPERSLVLVSMHRQESRLRLGLVARFDLPAARHRRQERAGRAVTTLVDQAVQVLVRDAPTQVVAVLYDGVPCDTNPPWQALVSCLASRFDSNDVPVLDALYVGGSRFRSYRCTDAGCCPPRGCPVDEASAVVAELVARGSAPLATRAALHELVRPTEVRRSTAVEAAARAEMQAVAHWWCDDGSARWRVWQEEGLTLLADVAGRYLRGECVLADLEAGRLAAALCDVAVRDAAVVLFSAWPAACAGPEEITRASVPAPTRMDDLVLVLRRTRPEWAREQPTRDSSRCLDGLWLQLATSCDGQLAVAPLTVLGMHLWAQGNGALALAATERALTIDPGYRLARLLDQSMSLGLRPGSASPRG